MHRADEHVDLVALYQLVGIFRCLCRLGFVVYGEVFQLASAELAAALAYSQFETVGDSGAQLGVGSRVGEHEPDADSLRLGERERFRDQRASRKQTG